MLTVPLQRLIATKAVRVIDRAFPRLGADVLHQFSRADVLDDFGVNLPFALQQPENKAFAGGPAPTLTFAPTTEVSLVEFDLAAQFARLKLGRVIETFAQVLIDTRHRLLIQLQVRRQAIGWHLLVKAFDDLQFTAKLGERFLPATTRTFNVAASGAVDFERAAENALAASGKVAAQLKWLDLTVTIGT